MKKLKRVANIILELVSLVAGMYCIIFGLLFFVFINNVEEWISIFVTLSPLRLYILMFSMVVCGLNVFSSFYKKYVGYIDDDEIDETEGEINKRQRLQNEIDVLLQLNYTTAYKGTFDKPEIKSYVVYDDVIKLLNDKRKELKGSK